ncbi:MAG: HIT domain-containing protein [Nocardioides sp.]
MDALERLWTPYRMAYIAGASDEPNRHEPRGCPFCAMREPREHDLVVHRGETAFAVLNLHPYNPGHLMVLPYRHVADLEDLTADESLEMTALTTQAVRTIKQVAAPHAFNVGFNLGGVAGGSLASHLHQHVVPRWEGDANFMTVLNGTKVMPQLLEDTRDLLAGAWPV